jgi:RNA polymerase sigma-70 factor (ECF subfamily)
VPGSPARNPGLPPSGFEVEAARLYREVWGRAVAALVRVLGDIDLAEDVLQEAWIAALERWRRDGFPADPTAWLLTTARNRAIDRKRRERTFEAKKPLLAADSIGGDPFDVIDYSSISDDRLRLIFTCCHPALSMEARVALTLKTLGGLTTAEISNSFLVEEATMAQRLVRAKRKIKVSGIPYEVPADHSLPERLRSVLAVLYLVFTEGYASSTGGSLVRLDLCAEAIRLTRVLVELMPDEPEARGLLALMLLQHSRRDARVDRGGDLVLLEDQDRTTWDADMIDEGLELARRALRRRAPGPYQLQAAIAAVHASAGSFSETDWDQIVGLYDLLLRVGPSAVVELNRAVAVAMRDGPDRGLSLIDELAATGRLDRFHLMHAARADLLRRSGRFEAAAGAYERALALEQSGVERRYLERRLAEVRAEAR